jgi:hypothetical protein
MGLDITVYDSVSAEVTKASAEEIDKQHERFVHVYNNAEFVERQDDLVEGVHEVIGETFAFRAGSYSGYNRWRERLATFAGYKSPEYVWDHFAEFKGQPFVELIHFSDCEGTIGPRTSAKLAVDFAANLPAAREQLDEGDLLTYHRFLAAFTIASGRGCVSFC